MAVIQDPISQNIASVDARAKALRANLRPLISSTLGEYACSLTASNSTAAATAVANMWSFRYSGANLCIVTKVVFDGAGVNTAFTAGQAVAFGLFIARGFTASDTGGTGATLTGNNCKLRTSYATTAVADIRIGLPATGGLTAGTRTLDVQPLGQVAGGLGAVGSMIPEGALFDAYSVGHPIVLAQNEGLVLQNRILFPAAGVIQYGVSIYWTECVAAEWES